MEGIKLIVDGEERIVNIPTSWDEVTLDKSIQIQKLDNIKFEYDIDKIVKLVSILSGLEEELILMFTPDELEKVVGLIEFTKDMITNPLLPVPEYTIINGEEFYIKKVFDKLTTGEMLSLNTIRQMYDNDVVESMPKMLCLFLRKKLPNGELESFRTSFIEEREHLMRECKITDVYNLFSFFTNGKVD